MDERLTEVVTSVPATLRLSLRSFVPPLILASGSEGEEHTRRKKGDECETNRDEPDERREI